MHKNVEEELNLAQLYSTSVQLALKQCQRKRTDKHPIAISYIAATEEGNSECSLRVSKQQFTL